MKRRVNVLTTKQRKLSRMTRECKRLARDLNIIITKHNTYTLDSEEKAIEWFDSFPIGSLRESLDYDYHKLRKKLNLIDLDIKSDLRKAHEKKEEELELAEHARSIAEIDVLLEMIKQTLKD